VLYSSRVTDGPAGHIDQVEVNGSGLVWIDELKTTGQSGGKLSSSQTSIAYTVQHELLFSFHIRSTEDIALMVHY
jgi:hypothetical protein